MAVSAEGARPIAAKYLDPALQIVAVGNRGRPTPILAPHGPVTLYESDGTKSSKKP